MLGDEDAVSGDQLGGAFLLQGLVIPGTGEGDFHGGGGAHGAGAQEEGGVAGDDLGVGERADVAQLGLILGDGAGLDQLVELQARGDAAQVAALVDGGEGIVVVAQALGVGAGAGGVAELDLGALLGGLDHVVLMAEGIREHDVAAGVHQVQGGLVALLALGDVGLQNGLDAQLLAGFGGRVDEVEVVGGVLVVQEDEADFRGLALGHRGGREQADDHGDRHQDADQFLHTKYLLYLPGGLHTPGIILSYISRIISESTFV